MALTHYWDAEETMTKTYDLDLREYDISAYEDNPIVVVNFDYTGMPTGKAKIASDKQSVEVEFYDDKDAEILSSMELAESFSLDTNQLIALSLVTLRKPKETT